MSYNGPIGLQFAGTCIGIGVVPARPDKLGETDAATTGPSGQPPRGDVNRAERIYRVHGLLRRGRPVSMERLRDDLQCSRATVVRDIGYMRDFMRAPIQYDASLNGYRYDPDAPAFELPGLWFNEAELYALLASEQLLESVHPGFLSPYIGPLRSRIRSLLSQSGHSAETVIDRVQLRAAARRAAADGLFQSVAAATLSGKVLAIDYHGRERGELTSRCVHPQRLLHYRDNWYLVAWCEQADDLRTFSLERISGPVQLDVPSRTPDRTALDRHLESSFGIFTGAARAWAVLRFTERMARWVADERWHPDQIGRWEGDRYELQVPYSDERELLMDILKYGPEVEVIAPDELRGQVADRLRRASGLYES